MKDSERICRIDTRVTQIHVHQPTQTHKLYPLSWYTSMKSKQQFNEIYTASANMNKMIHTKRTDPIRTQRNSECIHTFRRITTTKTTVIYNDWRTDCACDNFPSPPIPKMKLFCQRSIEDNRLIYGFCVMKFSLNFIRRKYRLIGKGFDFSPK